MPKPDPRLAREKAIGHGELCARCGDETGWSNRRSGPTNAHPGCTCSRRLRYLRHTQDAEAWILEHADEFSHKESTSNRIAVGLAHSVANRQSRRAGLSPEEKHAERVRILNAFGQDANYHEPHRHEQDHMPY